MGKGARNRKTRAAALALAEHSSFGAKTIARALRKGRMPLTGGLTPGIAERRRRKGPLPRLPRLS